jgi:hypothetical protein
MRVINLPRASMRSTAALMVCVLIVTACSPAAAPSPSSPGNRELAWCLASPGAITAVVKDAGGSVPPAAQAVIDDGISDAVSRWRFHDAWESTRYDEACSRAYVQFGGADTDVDLTVLDARGDSPTPAPTRNIGTADLRVRARELVPQLAAALHTLSVATEAQDPSSVSAAATALSAITQPELDALRGAVADACIEDAGAAYGAAVDHASLAASQAKEWAGGASGSLLDLAVSFIDDAEGEIDEFRRLDAAANC